MLKVKRYTATWCQPCKILAPIFDQLQSKYSNVFFETIDVNDKKEKTLNDGVTAVPTVILEKNGKEIRRFTGVKPKQEYAEAIEANLY